MRRSLRLVLFVAAFAAPSSAAAAAPIAHPTGRADVVIRVTSGGGFVAPRSILGALPAFTLYGDGSLVVPGPVPQISPGRAISQLLRTRLNERQVQAILRRAQAAGLLAHGAIDYGDMGSIGVADAPTTTVRMNAAGSRITRAAYALDIAVGEGRLPDAEARARRALRSFIAGLPHGLGGARYVPRAIAVYVSPSSGQTPSGSTLVTWPLASDLATAGKPTSIGSGTRCITVSGRSVGTLLAALRGANDASRWRSARTPTAYSLVARPLLPDERDCASLAI
jgi:hypothetical protein